MLIRAELTRRAKQAETQNQGIEYAFRGNVAAIQDGTHHIYILAGGAETGKTIGNLSLLNRLAWQYPGMQGTIIRKWRADMDSTCLLQFRQKILGKDSPVRIFGGEKPERFIYPNGSTLWVGGIDRPGSALSGERDAVCVVQAEELVIEDWETLSTRTTGRAGIIQPAYLFGDCNPRGTRHWILQLAQQGALELLATTHRDNPSLFSPDGTLTEQGQRTIERLSKLTGTRRKRLFEHQWVTPEGVVFNEFDRETHVKKREATEFQYWLLAMDEGFTNPAVTLVVGIDSDLRLHVATELYQTQLLPSKHANATLALGQKHKTRTAICDPSAAGLIAEIRNAGGSSWKVESPKEKSVERGIDLLHELLAVQKDSRARLTIDPQCANTINEFESFENKKEFDHAISALRYLCCWLFADELETRTVNYLPVKIDSRW